MLLRRYKPDDFAALYAIEEACFQPPFRFGRRYMQKLIAAPQSATWIAESEARLAGFAIVEWNQEMQGVIAYIQTIEVAPEFRRRGIGAALMHRAQESAREAGAAVMWLHVAAENAAAIRLYEEHGYRYFGSEEHFYASGRAAHLYRKALLADEATEAAQRS
jgi:ribosomal protein S18 acetylase RimI-like enzyme